MLLHVEAFRPLDEVLSGVEALLERPLPGIRTALDPSHVSGWEDFLALYRDVEALGEAVDAW